MYEGTGFVHSPCIATASPFVIKQWFLFLVGDMAISYMNITILQIFLFDESLPVFLVTGYFIEIMVDFSGQSQY